jgi:hypothetical protein
VEGLIRDLGAVLVDELAHEMIGRMPCQLLAGRGVPGMLNEFDSSAHLCFARLHRSLEALELSDLLLRLEIEKIGVWSKDSRSERPSGLALVASLACRDEILDHLATTGGDWRDVINDQHCVRRLGAAVLARESVTLEDLEPASFAR